MSPRSTGKSTNAAWLLHAIHERQDLGRAVVGFDADESSQLSQWYAANAWPMPVHGAANRMAHQSIPAALPAGGLGVVDVGHLENHRDVGYSVGRIADLVLINCAPTLSDVERLEKLPMRGFLDDCAPQRADSEPPEAWVLLTRCQPGTSATLRGARDELQAQGWNILTTTIPAVQRYAQTGEGAPIVGRGSAHDELLTELLERGLI